MKRIVGKTKTIYSFFRKKDTGGSPRRRPAPVIPIFQKCLPVLLVAEFGS